MSIDEAEELRLGKRKNSTGDSLERLRLKARLAEIKLLNKKPTETKTSKSVQEAYQKLLNKRTQEIFKKAALQKEKEVQRARRLGILAGIGRGSQQIQSDISQGIRREGIIRSIASKAERIENKLVGINEVPFLMNLERARMDVTSPPDRWIENIERNATRNMPD